MIGFSFVVNRDDSRASFRFIFRMKIGLFRKGKVEFVERKDIDFIGLDIRLRFGFMSLVDLFD